MMDVNEQVIVEVEKKPILFDKSREDYKRSDIKDDVWRQIGARIGVTGAMVQAKWRNIRDYMAKYHKRNTTRSGQGAKDIKAYKYAHILDFLIPTLAERKTSGNMNYLESNDRENDILNLEIDDDENDDDDDYAGNNNSGVEHENENENIPEQTQPKSLKTPRPVSKTTSKPPRKKSKLVQPPSDVDKAIVDYLQKKKDNPPPKVEEDDEIGLFLKSMASNIRKLPERIRADLRFSIHKLVHEAEMKHMYGTEKKDTSTPIPANMYTAMGGMDQTLSMPNMYQTMDRGPIPFPLYMMSGTSQGHYPISASNLNDTSQTDSLDVEN